jgi:topoisomerase-4 subunit B
MVLFRQPLKLYDCDRHGPDSGAELFIVEGDSASGAVAKLLDREFQAVLPIQGKPLNAARAKEATVRKNPFLSAVIEAIGAGIGEKFRLQASRFERIFLLCDPDADGIHCATLLLLFFHRCMPAFVEAGNIVMVRPPLMQIVGDGIDPPLLAYSEEEGARLASSFQSGEKISKRRFRGLAAIPAGLLKINCIDPRTRRIEVMTSSDVEACRRMLLGEI